jgi:hypothetical protein
MTALSFSNVCKTAGLEVRKKFGVYCNIYDKKK